MKGDGKLIMQDPVLRKMAIDLKRSIDSYRGIEVDPQDGLPAFGIKAKRAPRREYTGEPRPDARQVV